MKIGKLSFDLKRLIKLLFVFIIASVLLSSCNRNKLNINTSGIEVELKIKHLEDDLLRLSKDEIANYTPSLKVKYGEFFDIFTYQMIAIGGTDQENFNELLYSFVSDTLIKKLVTEVAQKIDTTLLSNKITEAFKHFSYYFPNKQIPEIFTCISGFNQSIVTSDNLIGISLDKYIDSTSEYYQSLALPDYKRRNMHPGKITSDMMYAWAITEWPKEDTGNNLLSHMIYEGKIMYFIDAMLPSEHDSLKFGITKRQLDFCNDNEFKMWTFLAEQKLLFTTDRMSIKRFIDDGPYTSSFTNFSPGRTGSWLGWQIVRSYMKKNPAVSLSNLISNNNFQDILNNSGYKP